MSALIRILFPAIGYFCVAAVIAAVGGYGYMMATERLDNEKLFRIAAIVHGVDLEAIAQEQQDNSQEVPPAESSYEQQRRRHQMASLQIQAKQNDLTEQLNRFDHQIKELVIQNARYQQLRDEVDEYLKQQSNRAVETGRLAFREQLKSLDARKQAMPLLKQMIQEGELDEVILALNGLPTSTSSAILKAFKEPEDIQLLRELHKHILAGHPVKPEIDRKLKELEKLKQQDR